MDIEQRLEKLERAMREHTHKGIGDSRIDLFDLFGLLKTVSSVPTHTPRTFQEQFVIYVSGVTYRLYWYDINANAWHYVTATA